MLVNVVAVVDREGEEGSGLKLFVRVRTVFGDQKGRLKGTNEGAKGKTLGL